MKDETSSYKEIIKTTGIYGTSQLVNIVLGIVRSKLTAILIGTVGIGTIGIFQSVIDLTRSATGLGLDTGATKKIAITNSSSRSDLPQMLYSVNILYLFTAILGGLFCIIFAKPISTWAFDSPDYSSSVVYLSVAVIIITFTAGLTSCLQGMRKITYMALASTLGSLFSLLVMIPIYYFLRVDGIIWVFICSNLVVLFVALFFYRKVDIKIVKIPFKEIWKNGREIVSLGIYIVLAGILSAGSLFLVRIDINSSQGIDQVGLFQAAWLTITMIWGIVLRTANSDFLPRLCSVADQSERIKRYVNEQTHIILFIAVPLVIGLLTYAKLVLNILYTSEFTGAVATFRWHLVGMLFKLIATPIAMVMLAKNKGGLHFICEAVFWGVYLTSYYLLSPIMGFEATGIAYLVAYIVYMPMVLIVSHKISGAMWDLPIFHSLWVNSLLIAILYVISKEYPHFFTIAGSIFLFIVLGYSLFRLRKIINYREVIKWLRNKLKI